MIRSTLAVLAVVALVSTACANIPYVPLQAGAGKKTDPATPAESRKKIIEELQVDYEKVLDRLKKDDAGAETRKNQQRILDNLDKLLQQQDPSQGGLAGSDQTPKPMGSGAEKPAPKPGAGNPNKPAPKPNAGNPNALHGQAETKQRQQGPLAQQEPKTEIGRSQLGEKANTIEDMKKEAGPEEWRLPLRHRQEMDAFARERFIRNYEEVLRQYYRNIADSSRRKEVE